MLAVCHSKPMRALLLLPLLPATARLFNKPAKHSLAVSLSYLQRSAISVRQYAAVPSIELTPERKSEIYHLGADRLQQILAQADAEVQKRLELRKQITEAAANRFFDAATARCNWEALATEFGLPLIDCLRLFDLTQSSIQPRAMPIPHRWTVDNRKVLTQFVADHFGEKATGDWVLADVYMNTNDSGCFKAFDFWQHPRITAKLIDDLNRHRTQGVSWKAIYLMYPYFLSYTILASSYSQYVSRQDTSKKNDVKAVQWAKAERQWIKDIIWEHRHSIDTKTLAVMVQREFPDKPLKNIRNICSKLLAPAKHLTFCLSDMVKLRQMVSKHGEDWARIDNELGTFPGRAQHSWIKYSHVDLSDQWTDSELQKLRICMDKGMGTTETSRYIGTRMPIQCGNKMNYIRSKGVLGKNNEYKNEKWTSNGDRRLLLMVDTFKRKGAIDWDIISEALCRPVNSCYMHYQALQSIKEAAALSESQPSKADSVTREVQQQQLSLGEVD
ncbi:hypothetical protein BX661DRAFT_185194 [Kickxella alabastrina]|uniref:uncharacterized protein n=1 Tax=Kickxella alabastrina TaxID=61397 RepID=UPI00221FC159|nr:uncharacterized protein BX661DRAFT_185194 [Kickxella alabastrina]KAI7825059.1 hypothetical protein BX661DRAFT_185194 [Kickxella alabastrina]